MSATITPPRKRECELCGRRERWNDEAVGWQIADEPARSTASTSGTSTGRSRRSASDARRARSDDGADLGVRGSPSIADDRIGVDDTRLARQISTRLFVKYTSY